jgi:hypothetical protein
MPCPSPQVTGLSRLLEPDKVRDCVHQEIAIRRSRSLAFDGPCGQSLDQAALQEEIDRHASRAPALPCGPRPARPPSTPPKDPCVLAEAPARNTACRNIISEQGCLRERPGPVLQRVPVRHRHRHTARITRPDNDVVPAARAPAGTLMQWSLNAATILGWLLSSIFVLSLANLARSV